MVTKRVVMVTPVSEQQALSQRLSLEKNVLLEEK